MPNPKAHVAIDLETLSTSPAAVVLAIGAVAMAEDGDTLADFYSVCSIVSQQDRQIDKSTLDWWERQAADARSVLDHANEPSSPTLDSVLDELTEWIGQLGETHEVIVHGNGAAFDIAILEHAYKKVSPFVPWNFRNVRDMRTLRDICLRLGLEPQIKKAAPRTGTHHNALDDAHFQARIVIESLKAIETYHAAHTSTAQAAPVV